MLQSFDLDDFMFRISMSLALTLLLGACSVPSSSSVSDEPNTSAIKPIQSPVLQENEKPLENPEPKEVTASGKKWLVRYGKCMFGIWGGGAATALAVLIPALIFSDNPPVGKLLLGVIPPLSVLGCVLALKFL